MASDPSPAPESSRGVRVEHEGGTLTIRSTRSWVTLIYLVGAITALALAATGGGGVPLLLLILAWLLHQAWTHRGASIVLDDVGIRTVGAGRKRSYAVDELLEVGWVERSSLSGVMVRPAGGPYDVPGPNAPELLFTLPTHGSAAHRKVRDGLTEWCERHGVTFTPDGIQLALNAPPGSRFRQEVRSSRLNRWVTPMVVAYLLVVIVGRVVEHLGLL